MEENENDLQFIRERRKQKDERKSDHIARMMVCQFLICTVLVSTVFAVSKLNPNSFEKLKTYYLKYTKKDMSVSEIFGDIKGVAKFFKNDTKSVSKNLSPDKVNVEVDEDETLGKGGDDMQVYAATNSSLFSPFLVSTSICTPVSGRISSNFGYRVNPVTKKWSFHSGVDIAASSGEKIKSAFYGKITEVGYDDASGNYIVIKHSGELVTKYLHCSKILAKENSVVRQGEVIALVGSTGRSTGPHLHFMIEVCGKKVNPLYVLKNNGTSV